MSYLPKIFLQKTAGKSCSISPFSSLWITENAKKNPDPARHHTFNRKTNEILPCQTTSLHRRRSFSIGGFHLGIFFHQNCLSFSCYNISFFFLLYLHYSNLLTNSHKMNKDTSSSDYLVLKTELRSLLISSQQGCSEQQLIRDYAAYNSNKEIPFRRMGYTSLIELLRSMPDVARIDQTRVPVIIHGIPDQSTVHIKKFVMSQRKNKKAANARRGMSRSNYVNNSSSRFNGSTTYPRNRQVIRENPTSFFSMYCCILGTIVFISYRCTFSTLQSIIQCPEKCLGCH